MLSSDIRRIWLNRSKGSFLKVKIVPFLHFGAFSQKLVSNFLFYFGMNLARDGTNQLPKAGFD